MRFNEKDFLALLNKKFHFDTSDQEDEQIERLIKENDRASELYAMFEEYFFPADQIAAAEQSSKEEEINLILLRGKRKIYNKKRMRIIVLILLVLLLMAAIIYGLLTHYS
jgi:hypothetical protein